MLARSMSQSATFERSIERFRHAVRAFRVRDESSLRRGLVSSIPRRKDLDHLVDERTGYALLPIGTLTDVPAAVEFAQQVRNERCELPAMKKKREYNPTILEPKRYEDAPHFFDLALSNEALQIVSDYLGEIPVLISIKLWHTRANSNLMGSQLFHRDGQKWLLRRAKFLINMDDVGKDNGPFTFLPADVSDRISQSIGSMKLQARVTDEIVYRHAQPSDVVSLVGAAGTGAVVDSSRCFHFGARTRVGERLLLMFHYLPLADAVYGGYLYHSPGFADRFGDNPIRKLLVPNAG